MEHRVLIDNFDNGLSISNMGVDRLYTITMHEGKSNISYEIDADQLDEMIRVLLDLQEDS